MVGWMCLNVMLTLILLTWNIGWAPHNASKWQVGFNSAFKGLTYTYIDGLVRNTDEVLLEQNFCTLFMGAPGFKGLVSVEQIKRSEKRLLVLYYATKCTFLQLIWTGCESSPLSACGNETLSCVLSTVVIASDLMELRTHADSAMNCRASGCLENVERMRTAACKNGYRETHNPVPKLCCLTLRWLMSYIYGAPILDVSRSHTTTQHSR